MHRLYLSGAAAVAAELGATSQEAIALALLYTNALDAADAALRQAFGADRVATVVIGLRSDKRAQQQQQPHSARFADASVGSSSGARQLSEVRNGTLYYSQADIADSQIFLWSWVTLLLVLLGTVCWMLGMDSAKDPALYSEVAGGGGAHHRAA
jgi:hypothetical protein